MAVFRCQETASRWRFVAIASLLCGVLVVCESDAAMTPVELAEQHIGYFDDGDVDDLLGAFAHDTVIGDMGNKDDADTISAVAFMVGASADTEGYVAVCEPWGEDGAKCEGPLHDMLLEPGGLLQHKTMVYQFDKTGKIARLGSQLVHGYPDDFQHELDLVTWISENYPDEVPDLIEYGVLKLSGADTVEELIPLVDEFIEQSTDWPKAPRHTPDILSLTEDHRGRQPSRCQIAPPISGWVG
jgi:hypothetical protein